MTGSRAAVCALTFCFSFVARAATKPCPAVIGIAKGGAFYAERGGAWVRQSPKVLQTVVLGGCYPEGGPSPTSSVALFLAPGAPKTRIAGMYTLLDQAGWPQSKVTTAVWKNSPQEPR